jgi:hypothetical protein
MTTRSTMADLIQEVKVRINAGTAFPSQSGAGFYWSGEEIEKVLDRHRVDIWRMPLQVQTSYEGATVVYKNFYSHQTYLEATDGGTAIFYIENGSNQQVGTANYNVDYQRGVVTFNADQGGTTHLMTARSYDPDAAAAEIWKIIASTYATSFDFSTDNHSIKRGDVMKRCMEMAQFYESRAKSGGFNVTTVYRSDYADW